MKNATKSRFWIRAHGRRGFTLIELLAAAVVVSIISAVAVPKYIDYTERAKTVSVQSTLGAVRTAISNFYSDQAMQGTPRYPTSTELAKAGTVLLEGLPVNPYNEFSKLRHVTEPGTASIRATGGEYGWCYYVNNSSTPPTFVFWCNSEDPTTTPSGSGEVLSANEL